MPGGLDAGALAQVEPLFAQLAERPLASAEEIGQWLIDESELLSAYAGELARRYIDMTCHTDDSERRERYLMLERDVAPRIKVLKDGLDRKLLAAPGAVDLGPHYDLLLARRRLAAEIFREANTALEAEESELQTAQQELMGSLVVDFRGREHTLQQMAQYLEDPDRALRREAYLASLEVRRASWPRLAEILGQLISLRARMARNAGFDSYTPYRFAQLQRLDYGAEQCLALHDAIERAVVPAVRRLDQRRAAALGIERLRPWDLDVDPTGRPPLRPFETEEQLIDVVSRAFGRVDPRFAQEFDVLVRGELLDLMSRKGKAPGGYQYTLEDVRLPFVFANAVGTHGDVQTMLHEGGHAFHAILSRDEPLLDYRDCCIEFAETASMSMELMALEELDAIYGADDARRARASHFERVLRILPWIASIDAFQHWLYGNPDAVTEARVEQWRSIRARFAPGIDYGEIEDALDYQWASQSHLFSHAFYYIEYAIAQIAALQVWQRYRNDPRAAVEDYRTGLGLGGRRRLPELLSAAGVSFDLSAERLAALVGDVEACVAAGA